MLQTAGRFVLLAFCTDKPYLQQGAQAQHHAPFTQPGVPAKKAASSHSIELTCAITTNKQELSELKGSINLIINEDKTALISFELDNKKFLTSSEKSVLKQPCNHS